MRVVDESSTYCFLLEIKCLSLAGKGQLICMISIIYSKGKTVPGFIDLNLENDLVVD